jgi:hypothetical protein
VRGGDPKPGRKKRGAASRKLALFLAIAQGDTFMAKATRTTDSRAEALRDWNKMLGLWRVCDNAACRRARACRGNVRVCSPRNFALAPEGVQNWFVNLVVAKEDGLSFDEALARIKDTEIEEAFLEWHAGDERIVQSV